ncbi:MAG: bacterial transcriptional activator domain-containing protein, partial [Acidimicrobiia bacterium]|nr:bacterial transcriptional activator domain-containing protein [Acidimicrobiia bacterium]
MHVDLHDIYRAIAEGDDTGAVALYRGPVLPEDAYEDWAASAREHLSLTIICARRRLASGASAAGSHDVIVDHMSAI